MFLVGKLDNVIHPVNGLYDFSSSPFFKFGPFVNIYRRSTKGSNSKLRKNNWRRMTYEEEYPADESDIRELVERVRKHPA